MDRALFGDEPRIVFFYLNFTFFRVIERRLPPLRAIRATLLQIYHRLLATLWQICYRRKRVYATLWQIFHRVSEVIGNPLANSSEVLATFMNSTYLPEGYQYPLILARGCRLPSRAVVCGYWITCIAICPINKERGNLLQYL
jgi:hypothetical protein